MTEPFAAFTDYKNGVLAFADDTNPLTGDQMQSSVIGFSTFEDATDNAITIASGGAVYGFVTEGAITLWDTMNRDDGVLLRAGRWFAIPNGARLHLHERTRGVAVQRFGYYCPRSFGGPIERAGRLKYIDGCSDSLLVCPPLLGDPCLNHLHFPAEVEQTFHTHPSVRAGAVARGSGWCESNGERLPLTPGMVWVIPAGCEHRFLTTDSELDVIAYHPDSDWGPTDTEHPMLNRTWVDGTKIDNTAAEHAVDAADLVR